MPSTITNEDIAKFFDAYKKRMRNQKRGIPKSRPVHMVQGNSQPIKRSDRTINYGDRNAYNISAELSNKENQAQRKQALIYSGIARPDYYSPSQDIFLNQPNITRKRK